MWSVIVHVRWKVSLSRASIKQGTRNIIRNIQVYVETQKKSSPKRYQYRFTSKREAAVLPVSNQTYCWLCRYYQPYQGCPIIWASVLQMKLDGYNACMGYFMSMLMYTTINKLNYLHNVNTKSTQDQPHMESCSYLSNRLSQDKDLSSTEEWNYCLKRFIRRR